MKVKKQEMIDLLRTIKPAVSTKGIVEQMDCFLFTGQYVFAYNDKISIGVPFKSKFNCGVSADEMFNVLVKCPDEEIQLEDAEDELKVTAKKFAAGIKKTQGDLFESLPESALESIKWKELPADLLEAVDLCSFSTAKDASVPFLNCVAVLKDKVVSSDNYRVSQFLLEKPIKDVFLLPVKSAAELGKVGPLSHYAINEGWILFTNKETQLLFCARVLDIEFPDVTAILDVTGDRFKIPDTVLPAIEACGIFADPVAIDSRMSCRISKDIFSCKSQNDRGWLEYSLDIKTKIDNLEFDINPIFLSHILKHATTAIYGDNKLLFRSGSFQHVVALC